MYTPLEAFIGLRYVRAKRRNHFISFISLVFLSAGEIPIIARSAGALMLGERPSESLFDAAAEAAARQDISPVGDIHATAEFKRHLAAVMTKRALRKAVAKAEAAA